MAEKKYFGKECSFCFAGKPVNIISIYSVVLVWIVFPHCYLFSGEKRIDLCLNTKTTAVNPISIISRTFDGYSHQPRMQNMLQK